MVCLAAAKIGKRSEIPAGRQLSAICWHALC
jgi:hypothetical protein